MLIERSQGFWIAQNWKVVHNYFRNTKIKLPKFQWQKGDFLGSKSEEWQNIPEDFYGNCSS